MASIQSLGVGSGLLTSELVEDIIAAEREATDLRLESRRLEVDAEISAFGAVRSELDDAERPFDIWTGVIGPDDGTHERLAEAGVTMVNGTNFLAEDGRTTLSHIDDKKRRLEAFAKRFLNQ